MRIAFISAEVVPFSKVGGLADVAGALPPALTAGGLDVFILTPFYQAVNKEGLAIPGSPAASGSVAMAGLGEQPYQVFRSELPGTGVPVYLIKNEKFFNRPGIYTDPATGQEYPDGAYRFIFFSRACLDFLDRQQEPVDVLHCHDSHTALIPALRSMHWDNSKALARSKTVLTIHNIAYQGLYPPEILPAAGIHGHFFYPFSPFEYWGQVNFLKAGIMQADLITTVSERYAEEIQASNEYGCGLEGVLRGRSQVLHGVLNGVDYREWDPRHDRLLPFNFDPENLDGKRRNKAALLETMGIAGGDLTQPLMGMVGRLVDQKGLDILSPLLPRLANSGVRLVVLGTGLPEYHEVLEEAAKENPGSIAVRIGFDNRLAHLIEAGSDMFLMPSRYEPCGLNQMYSLRYGTVPVVRATGGLADTVEPFDPVSRTGTGFLFADYTSEACWDAISRAIKTFGDRPAWLRLVKNGMQKDFSWNRSAARYAELFRSI